MNILSYNPGHDGAIAYLRGAHVVASIEAERHSNYRHSPLSVHDLFDVLGELDEMPTYFVKVGGGLAKFTSPSSPLLPDTVAC
jgi:hypothetical protein